MSLNFWLSQVEYPLLLNFKCSPLMILRLLKTWWQLRGKGPRETNFFFLKFVDLLTSGHFDWQFFQRYPAFCTNFCCQWCWNGARVRREREREREERKRRCETETFSRGTFSLLSTNFKLKQFNRALDGIVFIVCQFFCLMAKLAFYQNANHSPTKMLSITISYLRRDHFA